MKIPVRWFRRVADDASNLPDAVGYYMSELDDAQQHLKSSGSLERALAELPGLWAYYDAMHTDLDSIASLFEMRGRVAKARAMRQLNLQMPGVKLSVDVSKALVEMDDNVIATTEVVIEIRYVLSHYDAFLKALEKRGYTLTNISKIRVAGLEEVII